MAAEDLLDRAGELKRELVEFSHQRPYERAFRQMLDGLDDDAALMRDEDSAILLWDSFLLEHRLPDGRTVVEQFVDARTDLSMQDRQILLGWQDVITGVFEVQRRDGPALVLVNLVDDLTYRTRSTMGASVFRQMPKRSFLLTRLVAMGNEWIFSGPTSVLRPAERDLAVRIALEMAVRSPRAALRDPERLARAWELQRADRQAFIRFFGTDLVVVPGNEAQRRLDEFRAFRQEEILREHPGAAPAAGGVPAAGPELPAELVDAETVAFLYGEDDGLELLAEFGLVEEVFTEPDLLRRRRYREQVLSYLHDESVAPTALRRLADRDPERASTLFRRLLKQPHFDWARDGKELLRSAKPDYFAQPPMPRVTPLGKRLAALAGQG